MISVKKHDGKVEELTLGLSMVVRNEVEDLDRCLASACKYVDEIVIGYNGNNPETVKVMEKYSVKIVPCEWTGHHGQVRQVAFDAMSTDLVLWLDADDTLEHGDRLQANIQKIFGLPDMGALWMRYHYQRDENGQLTSLVSRERVVRRRWYEWRRSFHEVLHAKYRVFNAQTDEVWVEHHTTPERIASSNKRCLDIAVAQYKKEEAEGKIDPLTLYDLGRAYMTNNMIRDAIEAFLLYVEKSGWDDERYLAYIKMGELFRYLGEHANALTADLSAQKLRPEWPDAFLGQARTFFEQERWSECVKYCELASKCEVPWHMPVNPMKYEAEPLRMLHWAYFNLQEIEKAIKTAELGLRYYPGDVAFTEALKGYRGAADTLKVQDSLIHVIRYLDEHENGQKEQKIQAVLAAIPDAVADHPFFIRKRNELSPVAKARRLVLFCGASIEAWGPHSLAQGIGGSEEAVIHLMQRLAKRGWIIDIYGNTGNSDTVDVGGVRWHNYYMYDKRQPCEIFVAWRIPWYIDHACPEGARAFLWCHDVQELKKYSEYCVKRLEKIIVLSKFHRTYLPTLPDDLFWISRNGIEPLDYEQELDRVPGSIIYTSSPDRGLNVLLEVWPKIREAVPHATSKIFYGFTKNYNEIHKGDIRFKEFKDQILNAMRQPGIEYVGRKSHQEIALAAQTAELWFYPAHFPEISCISGMKAQAGGAIPVCTDYAALDETVQHGVKIHGSSLDPGVDQQLADAVIALLKDRERQEAIRKPMREWARKHYDWDAVAEEWHQVFSTPVPAKEAVHA